MQAAGNEQTSKEQHLNVAPGDCQQPRNHSKKSQETLLFWHDFADFWLAFCVLSTWHLNPRPGTFDYRLRHQHLAPPCLATQGPRSSGVSADVKRTKLTTKLTIQNRQHEKRVDKREAKVMLSQDLQNSQRLLVPNNNHPPRFRHLPPSTLHSPSLHHPRRDHHPTPDVPTTPSPAASGSQSSGP